MKKLLTLTAAIATATFTATPVAMAHCEVPCGIYTDDTVFTDLHTHQTTIEKAMNEINKLSKDPAKNMNQIVRWVNNKELHATKIQEIVAQYFVTQRIKIDEADKDAYIQKLTQLHQISVYAMKCKQTTDLENAKKLHDVLHAFQAAYSKK